MRREGAHREAICARMHGARRTYSTYVWATVPRLHMCMRAIGAYTDTTGEGFTTHYRARARVCVTGGALCQVGKPILKRHRIFIPRCAESVPIRVYAVCRVLTAPVIVPLGIWTTGVGLQYASGSADRGTTWTVREGSMRVERGDPRLPRRGNSVSDKCIKLVIGIQILFKVFALKTPFLRILALFKTR